MERRSIVLASASGLCGSERALDNHLCSFGYVTVCTNPYGLDVCQLLQLLQRIPSSRARNGVTEPRSTFKQPFFPQFGPTMPHIVITKMSAAAGTDTVISGRLNQLVVATYGAVICFVHFAHSFWKYSKLLLNPCQLFDGLKNVRIVPSGCMTAKFWVARSYRIVSPSQRRTPSTIVGLRGAFRNSAAQRSYSISSAISGNSSW
jgi:hypothetical protein